MSTIQTMNAHLGLYEKAKIKPYCSNIPTNSELFKPLLNVLQLLPDLFSTEYEIALYLNILSYKLYKRETFIATE